MLGGEFIRHGRPQVGRAVVVNPDFPGFADLGEELVRREEWYSNKEFASDLHALLVLQTEGMEGDEYARPPYPVAWARHHGAGRVWYHAMGHFAEVWDDPRFQAMLIGGLEWAGKRRDAEIPANLAEAAPGANSLPPAPGVD